MIHRRSIAGRKRTFAFLLLQLLLAAAAPLADGRLEARSSGATRHIESSSREACGLGHDHVFCAVCRALDVSGSLPSRTVRTPTPPAPRPEWTRTLRWHPDGSFRGTSRTPRAPPLA